MQKIHSGHTAKLSYLPLRGQYRDYIFANLWQCAPISRFTLPLINQPIKFENLLLKQEPAI
jgi:hypothetical protein